MLISDKIRALINRDDSRPLSAGVVPEFSLFFVFHPYGWLSAAWALHRLQLFFPHDQTGVPSVRQGGYLIQHHRLGLTAGVTAVALSLVLAVGGCSESSKTVRLAMKFEPGRELTWEQTSVQKISMANSSVQPVESRSKGEMIQKVTEVLPDGGAKIDETSTWSWSEKDTSNVIKVVSRNEKLSYQMATDGKITGLELPTENKEAQWKEYAQSNLEQSQPTFPTEPVGKGYTWMQTVKVFMPSGEKLDASTTYRVTDFVNADGHKCAVIDYKGNLILPFDVMESDTLTTKGVDRVDVTGTLMFDYENGYVFSQQEKDKITAERSKVRASQATQYTANIENEIYFHLKTGK